MVKRHKQQKKVIHQTTALQPAQNVAPTTAPIPTITVAKQDDDTKSTESSEKETELRKGTRSKSRVSKGGGFSVSDQRGRTEVGPQVEHSSAYLLFEELIYSTLEGESVQIQSF